MIIRYSSIIFYNQEGKVLIQDRRHLGKDDKEWSFFGGRAEGDETPIETAIREIQEEINIKIHPTDLIYLGRILRDSRIEDRITEGSVFISKWKSDYESNFKVLEGAGSEWVTLGEMRRKKTYDAQLVMIGFAEAYFSNLHA